MTMASGGGWDRLLAVNRYGKQTPLRPVYSGEKARNNQKLQVPAQPTSSKIRTASTYLHISELEQSTSSPTA